MLDPAGMVDGIMNRILDRIPMGGDFRNQILGNDPAMQQPPVQQNDTTFQDLVRQFESVAPPAAVSALNAAIAPDGAITEQAHQTAVASHTPITDNEQLMQQINYQILLAAARHNLDPELIRAVIRVESNFRPDVVSSAGAMGLMQLMPGTAESLGVTDPFDIVQNIDGGSRYLRRMLDLFNGDVSLALAAYNAGAGAVRQHGGIPPFRETQNFVPRVQGYWERNLIEQYRNSSRFG